MKLLGIVAAALAVAAGGVVHVDDRSADQPHPAPNLRASGALKGRDSHPGSVRERSAPGAAGPPTAPAEPTIGPLISGTVSELGGTHVWTDYAYDDRGSDAATASADNAADLIQLQVQPTGGEVKITAVLETLLDPKVPLLGVGFDLDADPATGAPDLPGGRWTRSGTPLGLETLVLVDAAGARVMSWNGSAWTAAGIAPAGVDPGANTIVATVPITGGPRWRVAGALGRAATSWAEGKGAIEDLAYVREKPASELSANFQSNTQAAVLTGADDAATAMASIDIHRLRAGATVVAQPEAGQRTTFLYRSGLDLGEGYGATEDRRYAGPYQPYQVWFPRDLPTRPPMIVFLHGASQSHLVTYYGEPSGAGEQVPVSVLPGGMAPRAVIVTPLGRGESPLAYEGPAEQDILDVLADATARFGVDEDRVALTGYSLGGVGTFKMAQVYPDKWAGAVEIVGAPDLGALTLADELQGVQTQPNQLENLRNLPFRLAHSRLDELELLVGGIQPDKAALELHRLGYDYRYWQFYRRDHISFPVEMVQCELEQAIVRGRVKDPARVVYSQEPAIIHRDTRTGLDLHHDHAYWMSDMVVRGSTFAPGDKGTVDITSLARPDRLPRTETVLAPGENVTAGRDVCGDNEKTATRDVWTVQGLRWLPGQDQPVSNGMAATFTRIASVTVDVARMGLDVGRQLRLELAGDGDTRLRLVGPWPGPVTVERGNHVPFQVCPRNGGVEIVSGNGTTTLWLTPAAGPCP